MEKHGGSEYHQPSQGRLRRLVGTFVTRHLVRGDDDVLILRGRVAEASRQARNVLVHALDSETIQAVGRAEAFLVEVDDGRVPASHCNELFLQGVPSADLSAAVHKWATLNGDSLQALREDAETCRRYRNDVSSEGLFEFCLTATRAEESLRDSLQALFGPGFTE
jgi:hypothetical protein